MKFHFNVERRFLKNKNSLINLYIYIYWDDAKIIITAEIIT